MMTGPRVEDVNGVVLFAAAMVSITATIVLIALTVVIIAVIARRR